MATRETAVEARQGAGAEKRGAAALRPGFGVRVRPSRNALVVVRLGLAAVSLIGLGVVVGASPGGTWFSRLGVVVLAAVAIALLAQIEVRRFAAGVALTFLLSGTAVFATTSAHFTAAAILLAVFFLAAAALTSDLAHLGAYADDVVERERESSLEALAAAELARARRHERPLAVVSLSLAAAPGTRPLAQRHAVAELARALSDRLRQNDIVGHAGHSRLVALLPETTTAEAAALLDRLRPTLPPDVATHLSVGISAFPSEEVTWLGLRALAAEREEPFARATPEADRRASGDGVAAREARIAELEAELADGYERTRVSAR